MLRKGEEKGIGTRRRGKGGGGGGGGGVRTFKLSQGRNVDLMNQSH